MIDPEREKRRVGYKQTKWSGRGTKGKGALKEGKEPQKQKASSVLPATKKSVLLLLMYCATQKAASVHYLQIMNNMPKTI